MMLNGLCVSRKLYIILNVYIIRLNIENKLLLK